MDKGKGLKSLILVAVVAALAVILIFYRGSAYRVVRATGRTVVQVCLTIRDKLSGDKPEYVDTFGAGHKMRQDALSEE